MSYVHAEGLTKSFGGKAKAPAVDRVDLEIHEGEFLVLLGPSGCGKTTTLRCLAGLETPTEGRIRLGAVDVFDSRRGLNLSPDKRNIGMVFQTYALWPHMTVRQNIAYPLRARRMRQAIKDGWVEEMAERVGCEGLLDRLPAQLSGGQQQRVAVARGLVARPDLILFDEPLSNLDARLRDSVRAHLHELHQQLGFTAVFVTHDQSEALALGDRLAVMRSGRIEQLDRPKVIHDDPATDYVANFVGMNNQLRGESVHGRWTWNGVPVHGPGGHAVGPASTIRVRPEDLCLAKDEDIPSADGTIAEIGYGGRHLDLRVTLGDGRVHVRVPLARDDRADYRVGDDVQVGLDLTAARHYHPETGVALAAAERPMEVAG
jgi:iron(III) transport system ATP-binding protein